MSAGSLATSELRALLVYDALPIGCIAKPVIDNHLAPHLREGEFAIVDTTDCDPIHGELFFVAWAGSRNSDGTEKGALCEAYQREHTCDGASFSAWSVGSMRGRLSPETTDRLIKERRYDALGWSNGPYRDGALEQQIRGRVVGVLAASFKGPKSFPSSTGDHR